jgi:hypothetical protein
MFSAALMSRSWTYPHRQTCIRSETFFLSSASAPHRLHAWVVFFGLTATTPTPASSALDTRMFANCAQPASCVDFASGVRAIPLTLSDVPLGLLKPPVIL